MGYNCAVYGQKTYNGVAILAKSPLEDVVCGLPTYQEDSQARYIEAVVKNIRVASVYVPNGQEVDSDAYRYKLFFLEKLRQHLEHLLTYEEICLIGGDYNIAPENKDVYDPKLWQGKVLFSQPEKQAFRSLCYLGYTDAIRVYHQGAGPFTWWDYRHQSFTADHGLRIDHLLLSPQAADKLSDCQVDRDVRGFEKTSDHAPVWCQFNF